MGINHKYCNKFVHQLWRDGYLVFNGGAGNWFNPRKFSVAEGKCPPLGCGVSTKSSAPKKRFKKKARQKLWNNMKIERKFSTSSLLSSIEVPKTTAYSYIAGLRKAGYIDLVFNGKKTAGKMQGTAEHRYLLVRDTGRLAPIVRKDGCWDQNEQKLYPFQEVVERKPKAKSSEQEGVTHVA
ncbi:hypothetical protein [Grimontia hollisae]|uniref:hypothetical protein n=1 Tax=Grimontia hollisae TaxID=673 RepID=UPI001E2C01C3|nr:hypothetical protein [Grimontia hollisae]